MRIEKIIKEKNIDRSQFQEFSKFKFHEIIIKFYYAFLLSDMTLKQGLCTFRIF